MALFNLTKVNRTSNFIDRSNWGDPNPDAIFDDLKLFNRALTQKEIQFEKDNVHDLDNIEVSNKLFPLFYSHTTRIKPAHKNKVNP